MNKEDGGGDCNPDCSHYKRRCAFISPCCGKEYACRLCHDDVETHVLDRFKVTQIRCIKCQRQQEVSNECTQCGVTFGKYFCAVCRLFDDTPRQQFHCDGCGLCRVGGRDNFFHCERCDMCLGISLRDKHKCVEKVSRANCPVCMEDLHTSISSLHVPKCQHLIHHGCYVQLLKSGNFTCPVCNVSLEKMDEYWRELDREIASTPMPEEYRDMRVGVLCRDCHKESATVFHVFGLKCKHCGSYNTCRAELPPGAADAGHSGVPGALAETADQLAGGDESGEWSSAEEADEEDWEDEEDKGVAGNGGEEEQGEMTGVETGSPVAGATTHDEDLPLD